MSFATTCIIKAKGTNFIHFPFINIKRYSSNSIYTFEVSYKVNRNKFHSVYVPYYLYNDVCEKLISDLFVEEWHKEKVIPLVGPLNLLNGSHMCSITFESYCSALWQPRTDTRELILACAVILIKSIM